MKYTYHLHKTTDGRREYFATIQAANSQIVFVSDSHKNYKDCYEMLCNFIRHAEKIQEKYKVDAYIEFDLMDEDF